MDTIKISNDHCLFPEVNNLIIVIAGLATAMEYYEKGSVNFEPGSFVMVEGLSTGVMVRLPLHGPVEAAIQNKKPDAIELTVEMSAPSKEKYTTTTAGFKEVINFIFMPYLVSFYERKLQEVKNKFTSKNGDWPVAWRMAWVVRNAISHDGNVSYKNPSTLGVTWRGLTISPSNQGQQVLGGLMSTADLLILMIDMAIELE